MKVDQGPFPLEGVVCAGCAPAVARLLGEIESLRVWMASCSCRPKIDLVASLTEPPNRGRTGGSSERLQDP